MSDTLAIRSPSGDPACGHPVCYGAAAGYERLLAAHTPARPLLTPAGEAFVRTYLRAAAETVPGAFDPPVPRWDADARRLWLGDRLLREFRQPAPHQTVLLAAFEEGGWAAGYVDDPLPPEPGDGPDDGHKRLRETVHNLNQRLPEGTIRFHGDGTGEGVRWERCGPAGGDDAPAERRHKRRETPS